MASSTPGSEPIHSGGAVFADPPAAALLSARLAELGQPREHGWRLVKHNASRTVYRGQVDGQELYLKHYHSRTLVRRLARRLGRSEAGREMRFSGCLAAYGVPVARVLAAQCNGGREWLASQAVAPAEPADAWHARQLGLGLPGRLEIRRATVELAAMVARMHAAGVLHNDLHCGNILVRTGDEEPRLVLMDLHRAVRRRRLSRRARAANLAQLLHDRYDLTTRTERLRFLAHYLRAYDAGGTLRGWQIMVEHLAHRHRRRQRAHYDRRIRGDNRYFCRLRLPGGWRGQAILACKQRPAASAAAAMEFSLQDWQAVLSDPEALLRAPGVEVIKDSPSALITRRRLAVGPHELDVFIKRPRRKQAWRILLDCFRPARPSRAFDLGHRLLVRGADTALPLAAIERRIGPLLLDSILITEGVPAPRLYEFLETWLVPSPPRLGPLTNAQRWQLAQEVLWQLGRMLQRLHDNNFAHRDLKANNILVHWARGQSPRIVLVDLDGLAPRLHLTQRRKFQGLMRLNVSLLKCPVVNHAGRLRMLLGYLRRPGSGRIQFKPWWRLLERWSARKLNAQIRSRRNRQRAVRRPPP